MVGPRALWDLLYVTANCQVALGHCGICTLPLRHQCYVACGTMYHQLTSNGTLQGATTSLRHSKCPACHALHAKIESGSVQHTQGCNRQTQSNAPRCDGANNCFVVLGKLTAGTERHNMLVGLGKSPLPALNNQKADSKSQIITALPISKWCQKSRSEMCFAPKHRR